MLGDADDAWGSGWFICGDGVEFFEVAVMVPVLAWVRGYNLELYACVLESVVTAWTVLMLVELELVTVVVLDDVDYHHARV